MKCLSTIARKSSVKTNCNTLRSHPVGLDGQNHIVAMTPLKFLPIKEFEKRQKSIDQNTKLALMPENLMKIKTDVIAKKKKAKELKEMGNAAFQEEQFEVAEDCYSEAIQLNIGSRPLWTNRAKCRNTMKKYEEAISDCESALSIDSKCTESITQKAIVLMHLRRFDEAKNSFESLRLLGKGNLADTYLKKLHETQE